MLLKGPPGNVPWECSLGRHPAKRGAVPLTMQIYMYFGCTCKYSKIHMDGAGGKTSNITVVQGIVQIHVCSRHKQAQIVCKSQTPLSVYVHCTYVPVLKGGRPSVLVIMCLFVLLGCGVLVLGSFLFPYDYLS